MRILFIEDDDDKFKQVTSAVLHRFPEADIELAKSLTGGLRTLVLTGPYDVLLLDMSMPNYDVSSHEPSGGAPESYAGREILMQMRLREVSVPTIVITMFDSYGEGTKKRSAKELDEELRTDFAPMYRGMVYYNSAQEDWLQNLNKYILEITKK